jgi:hypothetical protein
LKKLWESQVALLSTPKTFDFNKVSSKLKETTMNSQHNSLNFSIQKNENTISGDNESNSYNNSSSNGKNINKMSTQSDNNLKNFPKKWSSMQSISYPTGNQFQNNHLRARSMSKENNYIVVYNDDLNKCDDHHSNDAICSNNNANNSKKTKNNSNVNLNEKNNLNNAPIKNWAHGSSEEVSSPNSRETSIAISSNSTRFNNDNPLSKMNNTEENIIKSLNASPNKSKRNVCNGRKQFSNSTDQLNLVSMAKSQNRLQSVDDLRYNMMHVLDEIKKRDKSKPIGNSNHLNGVDQSSRISPRQNESSPGHIVQDKCDEKQNEILIYSDLDTNNKLVKKLKQKFDNVDQTFIKVGVYFHTSVILVCKRALFILN